MKISKDIYWIIDFDSTFVKVECLPELAKIALADNPNKEEIVKEVENVTNMGMNGEITFKESLTRRIRLLEAKRSHILYLVEALKDQISLSIKINAEFIKANNRSIYVISGGFKEFVIPTVAPFGIEADHVLANSFVFDEQQNIVGFDEMNPLADVYGKAKVVAELNLGRKVYVIGDGMTDYEVKEKGHAFKYVAFVENVYRPAAVSKADLIAKTFDDVVRSCG